MRKPSKNKNVIGEKNDEKSKFESKTFTNKKEIKAEKKAARKEKVTKIKKEVKFNLLEGLKNIIEIFLSDFKRITKTPIAVIILIGLCIIPGIYAWLNIDSNWNPYDNTGNLPIAVVNLDEGYDMLGTEVNIGNSLVTTLKSNDSMKWEFDTEEEAMEKVESGDCYGVIIIPKDFSGKIATLFEDGKIEKPNFDFYLNQKKNPIAPIILNKAVQTVQTSLNYAFANAVVYKVLNAAEYADITGNTTATTQDVIDKLNSAKKTIETMKEVVTLVEVTSDAASNSLENVKEMLPEVTSTVNSATTSVNDAYTAIEAFDSEYNSTLSDISVVITTSKSVVDTMINTNYDNLNNALSQVNNLKTVFNNMNSVLNKYSGKVDTSALITLNNEAINILNNAYNYAANSNYASFISEMKLLETKLDDINATYNNTVRPAMENLFTSTSKNITTAVSLINTLNNKLGTADSTIENYITILDDTKKMSESVASLLNQTETDIDKIIDKIGGATTSELYLKLVNLLSNDASDVADFITKPIETTEHDIYSIDSYGSKMSPFYSVLACWVGCTLLVSVVKTKVKNERNKKYKPWEEYFGRYVLFSSLGILQGLIIGIGDIILGVQVQNVPLFLLTLILSSLVFMMIVYSLTVAFGKLGEATAIVIMVLQVAGSGGTFPIELVPRFFQMLQPYMPFYPAMNMLRETIGGFYKLDYLMYFFGLLAHTIIPLLICLVFRKPIIAFKEDLSEKLEDTDLIV